MQVKGPVVKIHVAVKRKVQRNERRRIEVEKLVQSASEHVGLCARWISEMKISLMKFYKTWKFNSLINRSRNISSDKQKCLTMEGWSFEFANVHMKVEDFIDIIELVGDEGKF